MKRILSCTLTAAILCVFLCGCGSANPGMGGESAVPTPYVTPEVSPFVSPMISPDMEDGIVDDTDGLIEDNDSHTAGNSQTGGTASPSPSMTTGR